MAPFTGDAWQCIATGLLIVTGAVAAVARGRVCLLLNPNLKGGIDARHGMRRMRPTVMFGRMASGATLGPLIPVPGQTA